MGCTHCAWTLRCTAVRYHWNGKSPSTLAAVPAPWATPVGRPRGVGGAPASRVAPEGRAFDAPEIGGLDASSDGNSFCPARGASRGRSRAGMSGGRADERAGNSGGAAGRAGLGAASRAGSCGAGDFAVGGATGRVGDSAGAAFGAGGSTRGAGEVGVITFPVGLPSAGTDGVRLTM